MSLHVEETGPADAPTIVFLHGAGVSGWMWRPQVAGLRADFHCLVPDLPEHGRSRGTGPFTVFDASRRVAEVINQRAHGRKAHLVGHSLGGQVTVAVLGLAPPLVDHAMVSSALLRPLPLAALMRLAMRLYAPFKNLDLMIRLNMLGLGVPEAYFADFAADTRQASAASLARIFTANLAFRLPPGLSRLNNPTLVTVGEREPNLMRRSGRELVAGMRGASGRLVENLRHNWNLAAPDLFNQTVRAWITDQELPAGLRILRGK